MKIAFVFPGQGSQIVGMGRDLADSCQAARDVFARAEEAYGGGLSRLCFEGPEEDLKKTANTQPAIVATSIASLRALEARGVRPGVVAGHSVGEYSALVAAGVIDEVSAIKLTALRGRLMEESCPAGTGGMAAIMGFEEPQVVALCNAVKETGVCQLAAINTVGQIVVAGNIRALTEFIARAKAQVAQSATMLPVSGPFHSALMKSAEEGLKKALIATPFKPASVPVVANVDAKPHTDPNELKGMLLAQLTRPVLWHGTVEGMVKSGVNVFVELGPGRVLSGLIKRLDRNVTCQSVRDPESLEKTVDYFKANGYPF
ncbi:MAG: ACP S-malonyltransferase [Candidatus Riflebacteria bacterium]|nr:ACP S-malonyltransferase [Candidatus Riflebacteria bacterium]